ncbi:MFS transporter [Paenibacillus elgii]|uniref:MFS transporter n=1 Tax=Paenibacillus elgii TaxID=189691 RepID=UPI000248CF6B|nr:MFS transporter [Paenibacillus elgii]
MRAKSIIFTSVLIGYVGLGILNPLVAPLIRELGLSETDAGWIVAASSFMVLLTSALWGSWSDRIGRKPVLLIGLTGMAASFGMFVAVTEQGLAGKFQPAVLFTLLLISRLLLGAAFPAVLSSSQAYMADITTEKDRAAGMSLIGAANGLGLVVGPAVGALLTALSLLAPIYLAVVLPLLVMLWVAFGMANFKPQVHGQKKKTLRKGILPYLAVAMIVMMALIQTQVTAGFYFQDKLGLSATETAQAVGAALFCIGFMMALVQFTVVRKNRLTPLKLLQLGVPVFAVGLVLLVSFSHIVTFFAAFALMGAGVGLAIPGFTSGASLAVAKHEQGAVAGMIAASIGIGSLLGPLAGTFLYRISPETPFWLLILLLALLTGYVWDSRRIRGEQQTVVD